ncbi:MAG: insulinase family protein [Candidatus Melainabacteria bacterium]|nr:insulinase family protein [Candidatus Melainabacteria bacterium]
MSNAKKTRFVRGPINGISEFKLGNGLKVLLVPDHSAAVVTTMVIYKVGSRNEGPGNTGSAHFFEHLMFKGSRRFHEGKGNNLDALLKQIGADYNAYTSNDETVYHEMVSSEYLELCLALEADRMRHLRVTREDRDSEMTVVRNEMEQGENHPYQVMSKKLWAAAFTQHPYHHDTIGSRTEVENVPLANMKAFYDLYYWPNNATLVVAGDFETDEALAKIEKHFGRLPRSPHKIPRVYTVEPVQEGENRFEIRRAGNLQRLCLGYHGPRATHPDYAPLDLLCQVLGSSYSRSSRLYKRLVEGGIASSTYAHILAMADPGLVILDIDLTPEASLADAETAVLEEIEKLKKEPVGTAELERIKKGHIKSFRLRMADTRSFAYQLAGAEAAADWLWLMDRERAIAAVTPEDLQRVANDYFGRENRTIGSFIPKTEHEAASGNHAAEEPDSVAVKPKKTSKRRRPVDPDAVFKTLARFTGKKPSRPSISQRITSRKLTNGLTVNVLTEKVGTGVVAVSAAVRAGNYFEPQSRQNLSDIVGDMLPMGSRGLDKAALADRLIELGLTSGLHVWVRPFAAQTSLQVMREDLTEALGLLEKVLREPVFNQADLDTVKRQWIGRYRQELAEPGSMAQNALGSAIYEPTHQFYQKSIAEQIADLEAITVEDLKDFHDRQYTPGNTILNIVGDIEADAAIALIEEVFGDWTGAGSPAYAVDEAPPVKPKQIDIKMPDKPGIAITMGKPLSLKKADPDYRAAQIASRILGGDTLTARLGKKLREEGGLTYGVYCGTWDDSFGGSPWYVSLSVNAANVVPAIEMARQVMRDFVDNGITERELHTEVESMIGQHNLGTSTLSQLAGKIGQLTILGMSLDEIDTLGQTLRGITVAEVNAAIKKYYDPSDLVTVVAGDF